MISVVSVHAATRDSRPHIGRNAREMKTATDETNQRKWEIGKPRPAILIYVCGQMFQAVFCLLFLAKLAETLHNRTPPLINLVGFSESVELSITVQRKSTTLKACITEVSGSHITRWRMWQGKGTKTFIGHEVLLTWINASGAKQGLNQNQRGGEGAL